ncbi:MAG TPA: sialate O-acetylesterase, partial [Pseudomonadales bacterium]|nr:sialate O-acetylesterase [Pseudomonadales bacterium]
MKIKFLLLAVTLMFSMGAFAQDTNFWIFVCFGQSNMEGFPGVPDEYKTNVPSRFQVLASVDFPAKHWTKGNWYTAVPQLTRPYCGVGPSDFFGRTMVSNLPPDIKIGVVIVAVGGCKIELFDKDRYQSYASNAPVWMKGIIKGYGGDPYAYLVEMAKLAQKDGVIKGILLHQGESNTSDKTWPNQVKVVYDNLITDLNLDPKQVPL